MVENSFSFNGISSNEFHMLVSGYGSYDTPQRDVKTLSVPGRNGDLTLDNGRYENVDVTYKAIIYKGLNENYKAFNSYMSKQHGYQRLEDTFHKDEFRLAVFKGGLKPKLKGYGAASLELTFNCKPQRFLKSGEEPIDISGSGTIFNPTSFDAKPLIKAYGSGTLSINGRELTITDVDSDDYIIIDSEMMNAYKGNVNLNSKITGEFPYLEEGDNEITFAGDLTIEPRWYVI